MEKHIIEKELVSNKLLEKSSNESAKSVKKIDFSKLENIVQTIKKNYQEKINQLESEISVNNQRLAHIKRFSDENIRQSAIVEESNKLSLLQTELKKAKENLNNAKQQAELLNKQFNELQSQTIDMDFEKDIDGKFNWFVKGEAFQQLQTEAEHQATLRKQPLEQATLAGRIKVVQQLENRLLQTIKQMQQEYDVLSSKHEGLLDDNKKLHESLICREEEYVKCEKDEINKQTAYTASVKELADYKEFVKTETDTYTTTINKLSGDLNKAKKELSSLEETARQQSSKVREFQLEIQRLQQNTTMVINESRHVEEEYRHWGGHIWGWSTRKRWVWKNFPITVPNQAVLDAISATSVLMNKHQHELNNTNTSIAQKKNTISNLQKQIERLETEWRATKNKLDAEVWRLEDQQKTALGELHDAQARKLQKQNEITHLKDLIQHKEQEIKHSAQILADKKNTLNIFQADLNNSQAKIKNLQEQATIAEKNAANTKPVEVVATDVATEQTMVLAEARLNIKSLLDNTLKEISTLEDKILTTEQQQNVVEQNLYELNNPGDQLVASKRLDAELICKKDIEIAKQQITQQHEECAELLHNILLGQGLVLSGYKTEENSLDNLITCLLQGIFASYPLYKISSDANNKRPETWVEHIEKIKQKFLQQNPDFTVTTKPLNRQTIIHIIDLINEEYQQDGIHLQVSLFGRLLLTKENPAKNVVEVNVCQEGNQFTLLAPEAEMAEQDVSLRCHQLLIALLPPHALLKTLCEKNIVKDCGKSIAECAPETLANYYRESLKYDFSQLVNDKSKDTLLDVWIKHILNDISIPQQLSVESNSIYLQSAHYCLTELQHLHKTLPLDEQQELYKLCKQHYLNALETMVKAEIKKQIEQKNTNKALLDDNKAQLAAKMEALENDIKQQQDELAKLAATIAQQEVELNRRQKQVEQVQQHYQQQSDEVDSQLQKFLKTKQELEQQLKNLEKDGQATETNISNIEKLRKETVDVIKQLAQRKTEIDKKLHEAKDAKKALNNEKIEIDKQKEKFAAIRQQSEASHGKEKQKIEFLNVWRNFIKQVHELLLNDEHAYKKRHETLNKLKEILEENSFDRLQRAYEFLITQFDCLKTLDQTAIKQCIAEANKDDFRMLSANWPNDIKGVLQDVLGDPEIHFDGFKSLIINGNNISWAETIEQLKKEIKLRINYFGLDINKNNKLIVSNSALMGIINELPDRLKDLLATYIEIHCQHYTLIREKQVVQNPRWRKLEEFLTAEQLTHLINQASIDFVEVLHAYADSIEIVAGHHLYLDEDIYLPGINLTCFSKDKIHCKENLIVSTSAKQLPEIKINRARDGDSYEKETGREGDDGLNGAPGNCAGHIIIKAENTIENLATLQCKANGSDGLKGQSAGHGGKGCKGVDMPDAKAKDTDGFGKAQFVLAQGKTPGLDRHNNFTLLNEFSGAGGDAGRAGLGGGSGLQGDIVIADKNNELRLLAKGQQILQGVEADAVLINTDRKEGEQGTDANRDAKGGDAGEPGCKGADELRNKKGFFSKTKTSHGHFPQRIYDNPRAYAKGDNALGINVSILGGFLGNSMETDGYSGDYHQQIRAYGDSTRAKPLADEKSYWQDAKRDKNNRRDKGKDNAHAERRKAESTRRQAKQSETMTHQLSQLTRIDQIATSIQQNHVWQKHDNEYAGEVAKYTKRTEQLEQEIQQCRQQEENASRRSTELSQQLQQNEQTIQNLTAELKAVNQLISQNQKQLNANDLAQLANLKTMAEQGVKKIEVQTELACADIDVSSQEGLQNRLQQLTAQLQNALQYSRNSISQTMQNLQSTRLLQAERLAAMQSEYVKLANEYNQMAAQKIDSSHLNKLLNEISELAQQEETTQKSEQTKTLKDVKLSEPTNNTGEDVPLYENEGTQVFFTIPSIQDQYKKVLELFGNLFGKAGIYKELERKLTACEAEQIWEITLNGLRRELSKQADVAWMKNHIADWRLLLDYAKNILKKSAYSTDSLNRIYLQLLPLAKQLEKVDKKHAGKCLLALRNLSDAIELRYLELLTEKATLKTNEEKQKIEQQKLLLEQLKQSINIRCYSKNTSSYFEQLEHKLSFLSSIDAFIATKQPLSVETSFAESFSFALLNIQYNPTKTANNNDHFKAEIKAVANKFDIVLSDQKMHCALLLAKSKEKLEVLIEKYDYAYIVIANKLYYKTPKKIKLINIDDTKKLLNLFPKVKNAHLVTGETIKVLIDSLTSPELQKIKSLTQHEHILVADNNYYFERLQFEIAYLYASAVSQVKKLENEVAVDSKQVVLKNIKVTKQKILELISLLTNAESVLGNQLFEQVMNYYQQIIILDKQLVFSNEVTEENNSPKQRSHSLQNIYDELQQFLKDTKFKNKDQFKHLPLATISQFIQTTEIENEEWLDVLKYLTEYSLFAVDSAMVTLIIFERIVQSDDVEMINSAYEYCKTILKNHPEQEKNSSHQFEALSLVAVKKQYDNAYEQLSSQLKHKPDTAIIAETMQKKLAKLAEIWFSPHCLLTVQQRIEKLTYFKNLTASAEQLKDLSEFLNDELIQQKQLLIQACATENKTVKTFAEVSQSIIERVYQVLLGKTDINDKGQALVNELGNYCFNLQLLLPTKNQLIESNQVTAIEKACYQLNGYLIEFSHWALSDKEHNAFWTIIRNYAQMLNQIINQHYLGLINNHFVSVKNKINETQQTLKTTLDNILKHYDESINKNSPVISTQKVYFTYLLNKLKQIYLMQSTDGYEYSILFASAKLAEIEAQLKTKTTIDLKQHYLVDLLNTIGLTKAKSSTIFGKTTQYPTTAITDAMQQLKSSIANKNLFNHTFTSWNDAVKEILAYLNTHKNAAALSEENSWVKQFFADSMQLFTDCYLETEEQEDQLYDKTLSFELLLEQIAENLSEETINIVKKFIQHAKLCTPKTSHYLYASRLLTHLNKEDNQQQIEQEWQKIEQYILEKSVGLFADIDTDLGSSFTKERFLEQIKNIKPAYNVAECKPQLLGVQHQFDEVHHEIIHIESDNNVNKKDEMPQSKVHYLKQLKREQLSANILKKIAIIVNYLKQDDLAELTGFVEEFLSYLNNNQSKKNVTETYYSQLITSQLAIRYRQSYFKLTEKSPDKSAVISHVDYTGSIKQDAHLLLATYYHLYQNELASNLSETEAQQKQCFSLVSKIVNSIIKTSITTPNELFNLFRDTLVEEKTKSKLPILMMVLPLLSKEDFTEKRCDKIMKAMFTLSSKAQIKERFEIDKKLRDKIYENNKAKSFGEGHLIIDFSTRVQLLQITLCYKVRNFVLAKLASNDPMRDIVLRTLYHIDNLIVSALQQKEQIEQKNYLEQISLYYQFILKLANYSLKEAIGIFNQSASGDVVNDRKTAFFKHTVNKTAVTPQKAEANNAKKIIVLENLLSPIEANLAECIKLYGSSKQEIQTILLTNKSADWGLKLREKYFINICKILNNKQHDAPRPNKAKTINQFKDLFAEAFIIAQANPMSDSSNKLTSQEKSQNEQAWLACVDYLMKAFKNSELEVEDINLVLESVVATVSFNHVYAIIEQQLPPLVFVKECLFAECLYMIKKCVSDSKQIDSILQQFSELKMSIFNEEEAYFFLRKFSNALRIYQQTNKADIYPAYLIELVALIKDTQAYKQPHLLFDAKGKLLNENKLLDWNYQLKREKYMQIFGLQKFGSIKKIDMLVQGLNCLEKEYSPTLLNRLMKCLQIFIADFNNINLVNGLLDNFVNHDCELTEVILSDIEKLPTSQWLEYIAHQVKLRFAEQSQEQKAQDRTAKQIIEEMRKEITGINKHVNSLIAAENSYLGKMIANIHAQFDQELNGNKICEWNENRVKAWVTEFKQNAVRNFSEQSKVVEFAAILMRACYLKAKKIPRPTQLSALLMFIDAVQQGNGRLANISTGEGKSLITVMTAIVLGLRGEKVDVITSNEVLAERDAKSLETLFELFDLKVTNNCDKECEKNENLRMERYKSCQIIYGTTGSFQRDLLLTNFFGKPIRGQAGSAAPGNSLIIDEVDSMFIDNAEKILYISHSIQDLRHLNDLFLMIWAAVNSPERKQKVNNSIEEIIQFIKAQVKEKNIVYPDMLNEFVERRLPVWIKNAYLARQMSEGKEYIIPKGGEKHNQVVIMDLDTGVEQTTTQWSNGLHQFIQLKHSQKISQESLKAVFMANAIFFRQYNGHIIGMTGTLGSDIEMDLMSDLYKIDYFRLPRNKEERYRQELAVIVDSREKWIDAIKQELVTKQTLEGSVTEINHNEAKETIAIAEKKLETLLADKQELERNLANEIAQEKTIQRRIADIITQLSRDVVVDELQTKNDTAVIDQNERQLLLAEKTKQEDNLKTCQEKIKAYQIELTELDYGKEGIHAQENSKRNAEYILANTGARPILIICETVKDVAELQSRLNDEPAFTNCNIRTLKSKDDEAPHDKLGPNDIIIATNIAGRGTDFETLDIVEKNKGLHVVLAYVPNNIRIEVQAFRRTARNGSSGSGSFIVYDEHLKTNPGITVNYLRERRDIEEARRLDKIRTHGIPKLKREQKLFVKFIELQKTVKEKLESQLSNDSKEFDLAHIEVQLKSLQNKWAFFLDSMETKINDVASISKAQLLEDFKVFADGIWHELNHNSHGLITEPAQLMRMARLCMDTEVDKNFSDEAAYRLATDYLDAIIEKEPQFAGFAHYYKAHCNFGQKKNDLGSKESARRSLKKAIDLLEEKIGWLSTSAQFIRVLRQQKQDVQGLGSDVDAYTRSISNEISLIQTHINAAKEALGTELTAESFKSGTVTGEEYKKIFSNVRQHLKDVVKGYRLSKKVLVKMANDSTKESIYYQDKMIDLPPMSVAAHQEIVRIIQQKTNAALNERETITPASFNHLFLSKQQFIDVLSQQGCNNKTLYTLHAEGFTHTKGRWDAEIFSGISDEIIQQIKLLVLSLEKATTAIELADKLAKFDISSEKMNEIIQFLLNKNILKANDVLLLNTNMQNKIEEYLNKIELSDEITVDLVALNLSRFPELKGKVDIISEHLIPGTSFTAKDLDISDKAFNLLFHLLKDKKYFKQTLLQRLNLQTVFNNSLYQQDIEIELQNLYASNLIGKTYEISLPADPAEQAQQLWSYLRSTKIVKDPAVKFKLSKDPEDLLDNIKEQVKRNIGALIQGKNKDELEKYVDSIYNTLEKSIGKIKQFKDLKIEHKTLEEFLQGGKLPPELYDFFEANYDIVLSLAEDKGWSWGAFVVALLGILQIAAGVLIGVLSFGGAAFLSAVLISEGIGDLIFAVQSSINGNFSWSAYGERKWQSLLISVATAGIGVGIGAIGSAAASATSTSIAALAKQFVVQLVEAGVTCLLSVATDQLVKQVLSLVVNELEKNFVQWVKDSAVYQIAEKRLQDLLGKLYDKFGAVEAGRMVSELIQQNTSDRYNSFASIFGAKLTETLQKLSSNLSLASRQLKNSGHTAAKLIGMLSEIASHAATASDLINKFRDIASLTAESLNGFEKLLEHAYNHKDALSADEVARVNRSENKEAFCKRILEQQTTVIVGEIKQFINKTIMQPGAQAILQMGVRAISNAFNSKRNQALQELQEKCSEAILIKEQSGSGVGDLIESLFGQDEATVVAPAAEVKGDTETSAAANDQVSNNPSSSTANRSPASSSSENNVVEKAKSFAERTQHHREATATTLPSVVEDFNSPWTLMGRTDEGVNSWSLLSTISAESEKYNIWDGLACVGGIAQIGGGMLAMGTGVGVPMGAVNVLWGVDNATTSCTNFFTGEHHSTYLHHGLQALGETTGLFGEQGATYAELGINLASAAPALVKGLAMGASKFGLFKGSTQLAATENATQTLIGTSTRQMRREAQRLINNDPNHPLKFLLNDNGRFFKTRGLSHAELMDNPQLIQMGHMTSKVSGQPERIMLQGAWENQFNAITIEHSSIGGYVHNTAIDIGGIAVDLPTARFWESIGWIKPGTVPNASTLKF